MDLGHADGSGVLQAKQRRHPDLQQLRSSRRRLRRQVRRPQQPSLAVVGLGPRLGELVAVAACLLSVMLQVHPAAAATYPCSVSSTFYASHHEDETTLWTCDNVPAGAAIYFQAQNTNDHGTDLVFQGPYGNVLASPTLASEGSSSQGSYIAQGGSYAFSATTRNVFDDTTAVFIYATFHGKPDAPSVSVNGVPNSPGVDGVTVTATWSVNGNGGFVTNYHVCIRSLSTSAASSWDCSQSSGSSMSWTRPKSLQGYQVQVNAWNQYGWSPYGDASLVTASQLSSGPESPAVSVVPADDSVEVMWSTPADGGSPVLNYKVTVEATGSEARLAAGAVTYSSGLLPAASFVNATLPGSGNRFHVDNYNAPGFKFIAGGSYSVSVTAYNMQGQSPTSAVPFVTAPPACAPMCNPRGGTCQNPCDEAGVCTCACRPGWSTTVQNAQCNSFYPHLLQTLSVAQGQIVEGRTADAITVLQASLDLMQSYLLVNVTVNATMSTKLLAKAKIYDTATITLSGQVEGLLAELRSGMDAMAAHSDFILRLPWASFDAELTTWTTALTLSESASTALQLQKSRVSGTEAAINAQLATVQQAVLQVEQQQQRTSTELKEAAQRVQELRSKVLKDQLSIQAAMAAYRSDLQTKQDAAYANLLNRLDADASHSFWSGLIDGIEAVVDVVKGAVSLCSGNFGTAIKDGVAAFDKGKAAYGQVKAKEAMQYPNDAVANSYRKAMANFDAALSDLGNLNSFINTTFQAESIMSSCAASVSCSSEVTKVMPTVTDLQLSASDLSYYMKGFAAALPAAAKAAAAPLELDVHTYVASVSAQVAATQHWFAELGRLRFSDMQLTVVRTQAAKVASMLQAQGATAQSLETAQQLLAQHQDMLWYHGVLALNKAIHQYRWLSLQTFIPSVVLTGSPSASSLATAHAELATAMVSSSESWAAQVATACWDGITLSDTTHAREMQELRATGSFSFVVPVPANTSFYDVRLIDVQAYLIFNTTASAPRTIADRTELSITHSGSSTVLGSDFEPSEFILSAEAYPFAYTSTGCAQTTRGTPTVVPGSPFGLWRLSTFDPFPTRFQLQDVIGVEVEFQIVRHMDGFRFPELWGVFGTQGEDTCTADPLTTKEQGCLNSPLPVDCKACSGHGACDLAAGCSCNAGYSGPTCAIDLRKCSLPPLTQEQHVEAGGAPDCHGQGALTPPSHAAAPPQCMAARVGPAGPAGPVGPVGPRGLTGPPEPTNADTVGGGADGSPSSSGGTGADAGEDGVYIRGPILYAFIGAGVVAVAMIVAGAVALRVSSRRYGQHNAASRPPSDSSAAKHRARRQRIARQSPARKTTMIQLVPSDSQTKPISGVKLTLNDWA